MSNILCFSIRYLIPNPVCHATCDHGKPEWPPSPLRLFQTLLDAAASRWRGQDFVDHAKPAFEWLQQLCPSVIIAPKHYVGVPYRIAVPNNDWDSPARIWAKGGEPIKPHRPIDLKTMKTMQPIRLICANEDGGALYYLYPLSTGNCPHVDTFMQAARCITHLGWGIDMAVGDAKVITSEQAAQLSGFRWQSSTVGGMSLRVPISGTFDDLMRKHCDILGRVTSNGFRPVPPLSTFKVVGYRRSCDPAPRPFAVFSILKPDASGYRAFDAPRRTTVVAGMVRHALARLATEQRPFGWSDADIATIIQGHAPGQQSGPVQLAPDEPRFAYLPLPSIQPRGDRGRYVGMIRRVLVVGRPGMDDAIAWVKRALSGAELVDEHSGEVNALLSLMPDNEWVAQQYWQRSSAWTTVTPVVIPGYDDRSGRKTEKLLRKALMQAGFSAELVRLAELDWRGVGFLSGVDLASRYRRPSNAGQAPVQHVRVCWRDEQGNPVNVRGPFAVGSGRFRGLGLFVSDQRT